MPPPSMAEYSRPALLFGLFLMVLSSVIWLHSHPKFVDLEVRAVNTVMRTMHIKSSTPHASSSRANA